MGALNIGYMQCGFVIKSNRSQRTLLLARQEQKNLSQWLAEIIGDHLFVFNTTEGVYLFLAEEHCTALLEKQLDTYLQKRISSSYVLSNRSNNINFFTEEVGQILQDDTSSCFMWKNFISSFLGQLNPFVGDSTAIATLFKTFVGIVKVRGTVAQLDYLKRKMNLLRERVDLGDLFQN